MNSKPRGKTEPDHKQSKMSEPNLPAMNSLGAMHSVKAVELKRILVPVDFSESSIRALDYALSLGAKLSARVTLLHVVEPAVSAQNHAMPMALDETNRILVEACRERLAAIAAKKLAHAAAVDQSIVRLGHPHSEITDTAKALGVDMIVVGIHSATELKQMSLGGTAERVVRRAACPVLIVPSGTGEAP